MSRIEIKATRPTGFGASIKVDDVEVADQIVGVSVYLSPNDVNRVTLEHIATEVELTTEAIPDFRVKMGNRMGEGRTLREALLDLADRVA